MQGLQTINKNYWVYLLVSLFIIINSVLIYYEFFYFGIVSIVLAIFIIAFTRLNALLYLIVFLTPFSVPLRFIVPGMENDIILPTEPLIIIVLLVFMLKLLHEKTFDISVLKHPISLAIIGNLIWIFLTSITSTLPLVSFKFFISRIWFLVTFYFLLTQLFRRIQNLDNFLWSFVIPLLGVIMYAIIRHGTFGFNNQQAAHFVSNPFFNDHTAYGATLAMVYPVVIYFFVQKDRSMLYKVLTFLLLAIFTAAIILSYTRATWVSLIAGLIIYFIIKFRVRFKYLLLTGVIGLAIIIGSWNQIMMKLEKNKTESSDYLIEHVQSISNVSTDASNLERINRWSCAIKMFKEKPILGWGPGTYRFQYGPFQMSYQKTFISTNAGIMGNAHSEYIGPLSEMGILGTVTFILIIIFTLIRGIRLYHISEDQKVKSVLIAMLIGLITYYIHGILNNFLDTDKASCTFWGYTAAIVALDIYHRHKIALNDKAKVTDSSSSQ